MADTKKATREQGATGRGTTTGASPGTQESEDAGMQQMSRMLREAQEEGDPEVKGSTGSMRTDTGMQTEGDTGDIAYIIYVQECAICERERGMSDRERGMAERERAMYDRECAMTDRERSSAWGESGGESSVGGMSSGQSRTGGRPGSSQIRIDR